MVAFIAIVLFDFPPRLSPIRWVAVLGGVAIISAVVWIGFSGSKLTVIPDEGRIESSYCGVEMQLPPGWSAPSISEGFASARKDDIEIVLGVREVAPDQPFGRQDGWLMVHNGANPQLAMPRVLDHRDGVLAGQKGVAISYEQQYDRRGAELLAVEARVVRYGPCSVFVACFQKKRGSSLNLCDELFSRVTFSSS